MLVNLNYHNTELKINLPDGLATVIKPLSTPRLPDQVNTVRESIRNPIGSPTLRNLVASTDRVAIAISPTNPAVVISTVLPTVLRELAHVPTNRINIILTAHERDQHTHSNLVDMSEYRKMNYVVINHDRARDSYLVHMGCTKNGTQIWINRFWIESDVRITLGVIDHDLTSGFIGGPELASYSLAGSDTITGIHDFRLDTHQQPINGTTESDSIHGIVHEIINLAEVHFNVEVVSNKEQEISAVFGGELYAVHLAACEVVRRAMMRPVTQRFSMVITTNSSYRQRSTLYHTLQAITAASQIVADGGTIICVTQRSEDIIDYKTFMSIKTVDTRELSKTSDLEERQVQEWRLAMHNQIHADTEVTLTTHPIHSVSELQIKIQKVRRKYEAAASICVIPEGTRTLPYVLL